MELLFVPEIRLSHCCNVWRFQPVSFSSKETCYYPCHLPPGKWCLSLQLSECLLALLSQLAEPAPWLELICDLKLDSGPASCPLFSPLLLAGAWWQVTRVVREKNAPKTDHGSYLFLVHLCLGEIFALGYVLFPHYESCSLPFSLHSPPLPFPIMANDFSSCVAKPNDKHVQGAVSGQVSVLFLDKCWSGVSISLIAAWSLPYTATVMPQRVWVGEDRWSWVVVQFSF